MLYYICLYLTFLPRHLLGMQKGKKKFFGGNIMPKQNIQTPKKLEAIFKMETTDSRTDIITVWFQLIIPGYEWTDFYVGLSKKRGEWLSMSFSADFITGSVGMNTSDINS